MNILRVHSLIRSQRYEISLHAQKERYEEGISLEDIERAILNGKIIERYPRDPRGASCLLLGYTGRGPIHIVCAILPNG